MKIVTPKEMTAIESEAYKEGASKEVFMETAGKGVAEWADLFLQKNKQLNTVILLCGKGNNSGDGYVAGRYLLEWGYTVKAHQLVPINTTSPLCQINNQRFIEAGGEISETPSLLFGSSTLIIDALFGTGFHGVAREPYATTIHQANQSRSPIIAIDIPSGLCGETGKVEGKAIKATETIMLGLPKQGFFLHKGWDHVGKLRYVDFGLPEKQVATAHASMHLVRGEDVTPWLPPLKRSRHKYEAGAVIGIAGSATMPGAAILSSYAAIRSGAGIVKLQYPEGMEHALSSMPPEIIKIPYNDPDAVIEALNKSTAAFIGPGIGKDDNVFNFLKAILSNIAVPCVIDADALNGIAEKALPVPKNAILTPHVGEMSRLLKGKHPSPGTEEFLYICQEYVETHNVTLILKGGPSFIFHPNTPITVNETGDPGMATAGSGDVLTGLLAALLAQKVSPYKAALLGTYLHGLAGEYAADALTSYSMTASHIIGHLTSAFKHLKP